MLSLGEGCLTRHRTLRLLNTEYEKVIFEMIYTLVTRKFRERERERQRERERDIKY